MPSVYTHFLIANETLNALPPLVKDTLRPRLPLYFFGAQGADFCFFYQGLHSRKGNFGSYLHRFGAYDTFRILQLFSARSPDLFAYAAGYICHYCADGALHPCIYAHAKRSLLRHARLESALDYLYGKEHGAQAVKTYAAYFSPQLKSDERQNLFLLYAAIAAKCGFPPLLKPCFESALNAFNAYLPLSFSLFAKPKPKLLRQAFGEDYRQKTERLFTQSVQNSARLIAEFAKATADRTPLSSDFANSLLTGQPH